MLVAVTPGCAEGQIMEYPHRARHLLVSAVCYLCLTGLTACMMDGGPDKGREDNPLTNGDSGKADSFFRPIKHGHLHFGIANNAELTADAMFHAWNFTLAGPAYIKLATDLTPNVDTVMYLFRKDPGASSWGHYALKSDDYDQQLYSRIELGARPGEYRVIVKGFKAAERGAFSVSAECRGPGCPSPNACDPAAIETLPQPTGFTQTCADTFVSFLTEETRFDGSGWVGEDDVCSLPPVDRRAVDRFRGYWEATGGWYDFTGGEPVSFMVDTHDSASGTQTLVSSEGDAITFLAHTDGNLVMLTHWDETPDVEWFCGQPDEPRLEAPACTVPALGMRHSAAAVIREQSDVETRCSESVGGPSASLIQTAACDFSDAHGLARIDPVHVSYTAWQKLDASSGVEVSVSAGGATATYLLGNYLGSDRYLFAVTDEGGTRLPCRKL